MHQQRSDLDSSAVKLLKGLQFDPGYLLLCDLLQARLDDLTDTLADKTNTDPAALHYWRAFRELVKTLKVTPASFATTEEAAERPEEETHPMLDTNNWARLARGAQDYFEEQMSLQNL